MELIKDIDDINRGDTIRIKSLDDVLFNIDYKGKEGIVERIDYKRDCIYGTWGKIELYPEMDELEMINHVELTPFGPNF